MMDSLIPRHSEKTEFGKSKLAVVIGKKASYVSEANAEEHIAGYILHNDYSERAWQLKRGGQWVKGKSADTFAPLGPWLATPDEIAIPTTFASGSRSMARPSRMETART
jgi:2-keto-4-pentenoate hydratase/2-oxohepta-3-ene-1,7-dioic acid hydratase in catechol pathway